MLYPLLAVQPSAPPPRTKTALVRRLLVRLITICLLLAVGFAFFNYVTLPTLDITKTFPLGTSATQQRTLRFSPLIPLLYDRLRSCLEHPPPPMLGRGGAPIEFANRPKYEEYQLTFRFVTGQHQTCTVGVPFNSRPNLFADAFTVWDIPLVPVTP